MEAVLNATVAGGVIIGACSDLILSPWASIIIGLGGGFVSLFGFEVLGPYLTKTIGLHDTAGIHNLHGMPGFLGGILSAICAGTATSDLFGDSILTIFPMSKTRTRQLQAGYQLAALAVTIGISLFSGTITGLILNLECFQPPSLVFSDRPFWEIEGISLDDGYQDEKGFTSTLVKNNEETKLINGDNQNRKGTCKSLKPFDENIELKGEVKHELESKH